MIRILFLSSTVAFLSLANGCASKQDQPKTQNQSASIAAVASGTIAEVTSVTNRSDRAPDFSWKDKNGRVVDFDSFRGKVTLLNFWATWCGPCKKEIPDLVSLSQEMSSKGVKVIGVSTDRGGSALSDVSEFVAQHGIPYQVVISNEDLESAYGNIRAIPTSFIIDRDGKIVQTIIGARSKEAFLQIINPLL